VGWRTLVAGEADFCLERAASDAAALPAGFKQPQSAAGPRVRRAGFAIQAKAEARAVRQGEAAVRGVH